jgi:hypothetical protein
MKESIKISVLSVTIGAIQMILFLPDGYSCIDAKSDVFTGISIFMPIQFCMVFVYSIFCKPLRKSITKYVLLIIVLAFWLYINRIEFMHREACWSTYLKEEINPAVVYSSIIPCGICIFAFYIGICYFLKKEKQKTPSSDKATNHSVTKLSIIIGFLLIGCSAPKSDFKVIKTEKVGKGYQYNPNGFIENNYGRFLIKTISNYDKQGKLKEFFLNRANGFLEYTPSELKEDIALLKSLDIDTIYSDKKYISYIKEKKNDTIFYLSNNKIMIKTK